jgi:hypothetical protein
VETDLDLIERWDGVGELFVNRFCGAAMLRAATNVGLIAYYDQKKPSFFEPPAAGEGVLVKYKFLYGCRRIWAAVPQKWPVQHAVTV